MKAIDLVLTNAKPGQDAEFNEWYDKVHIHDILRVPGIEWAQRFKISPVRRGDNYNTMPPPPFQYLALYELDGSVQQVLEGIEKARNAGQIPWSPALDPVFSAYIFEPISDVVRKKR
ncbi:MAG TPA: hypothetical protein VGR85_01515 [Candidatus Limnocylindria bacterium]|nr:hypothetical protein [Candidatus Limnocylindria bacterium]